jgi:hypothetical protein
LAAENGLRFKEDAQLRLAFNRAQEKIMALDNEVYHEEMFGRLLADGRTRLFMMD